MLNEEFVVIIQIFGVLRQDVLNIERLLSHNFIFSVLVDALNSIARYFR